MTVSGTQNDLKFREYFLTAEVLLLGKITKNIMNIKPMAPKKAAIICIIRFPKLEIKKLINDDTKSCPRK